MCASLCLLFLLIDLLTYIYIAMGQTTAVPDTPNKIFIGGLPVYLNEEQVVELLKSFGELRAFNLVKDPTTNQSKVIK